MKRVGFPGTRSAVLLEPSTSPPVLPLPSGHPPCNVRWILGPPSANKVESVLGGGELDVSSPSVNACDGDSDSRGDSFERHGLISSEATSFVPLPLLAYRHRERTDVRIRTGRPAAREESLLDFSRRPRRPMARTDLFQGSDASSILAGAIGLKLAASRHSSDSP